MEKRERMVQITLRLPASEAEALANEARAKKTKVAEVARRRISETYQPQVTAEQIQTFGQQIVGAVSETAARIASLEASQAKLAEQNKLVSKTLAVVMKALVAVTENAK